MLVGLCLLFATIYHHRTLKDIKARWSQTLPSESPSVCTEAEKSVKTEREHVTISTAAADSARALPGRSF